MVKREAKTILPTMKIKAEEENDLDFRECQVEIIKLVDIDTQFGKKLIAVVKEGDISFQVFVNDTSLKNLIEKFGDDDENYIGRLVNLTKSKNEKYPKNPMIVLNPVA